MTKQAQEINWYAVFGPTGQEDRIKGSLEEALGNDFRIIVPKRKLRERKAGVWKEVVRTLFPGYILLRGKIEVDEYIAIKKVSGIIRILESDNVPLIIPDDEIEIISRLTNENDLIDISNVLIEGNRVTVVDGPLLSCQGIIESVNKRKGRVKVSLEFMGESRTVDLSVNVVEHIDNEY